MIRAKNYKTVTKFVKVMPIKLWPHFFPDTVYMTMDCRPFACIYLLIFVH